MRTRLKLIVALAAVGLIEVTPARAGLDVPGTLQLAIDPVSASFGAPVRLTGTLGSEDPCLSGRQLVFEFRPTGSAEWSEAGGAVTSPAGVGEGSVTASQRGAYRGRAPAEPREDVVCAEAVSEEVSVDVAAVVAAGLGGTRLGAGGCARLTVEVRPPKPGTAVTVEQRAAEDWAVVGEPVLDGASRAVIDRCHGWGDIGRSFDLRASWPGDEAHGADVSRVATVRVVKAKWMRKIDRLVRGLPVSVSVREEGSALYRRRDTTSRIPASNQKLLLSMALLDRLGPSLSLRTVAAASAVQDGVVPGDLWLIGDGDPTTGRDALDRLAARIDAAGIRRVRGRVRGSTSPFGRDWFAPGWKSSFPRRYVAFPTALTFEGNERRGRHIRDPERRAAARLTRSLRRRGIRVDGDPAAGSHPSGLTEVAGVGSASLATLLRRTNVPSDNFAAEVLGKRLGLARSGVPGTIGRGAAGIAAWAGAQGIGLTAHDGSGLSYRNRVTAAGMTRLLDIAEDQSWGAALRGALPRGGSGTLRRRLRGVPVRAKTGTLTRVSALSGWVWLERRNTWAEFSILSGGISKSKAVRIEDAIVRRLVRQGR